MYLHNLIMADFCLAERFYAAFTSEQKWMNVQCVASWIWFTKWDCCYSCISKWIAAVAEIRLMINSLRSLFVSGKCMQRGDCLYFLSDRRDVLYDSPGADYNHICMYRWLFAYSYMMLHIEGQNIWQGQKSFF